MILHPKHRLVSVVAIDSQVPLGADAITSHERGVVTNLMGVPISPQSAKKARASQGDDGELATEFLAALASVVRQLVRYRLDTVADVGRNENNKIAVPHLALLFTRLVKMIISRCEISVSSIYESAYRLSIEETLSYLFEKPNPYHVDIIDSVISRILRDVMGTSLQPVQRTSNDSIETVMHLQKLIIVLTEGDNQGGGPYLSVISFPGENIEVYAIDPSTRDAMFRLNDNMYLLGRHIVGAIGPRLAQNSVSAILGGDEQIIGKISEIINGQAIIGIPGVDEEASAKSFGLSSKGITAAFFGGTEDVRRQKAGIPIW